MADGLDRPITALKPPLVKIKLYCSVRVVKETLHFAITKIKWLMQFKELIFLYTENRRKP
jgi:hypothetical protein